MKNRGLLRRAYEKLDTPYLVDEARLCVCIDAAKQELGDQQKEKHDKWTSRIVSRAVALFKETRHGA